MRVFCIVPPLVSLLFSLCCSDQASEPTRRPTLEPAELWQGPTHMHRSPLFVMKPGAILDTLTVSRDGSGFAYVIEQNGRQMVVWNGNDGEWFERTGQPALSGSGRHCGYWALRDKTAIVILDGKILGPWSASPAKDLQDYWISLFSENRWVAIQKTNGGSQLVVDGKPQPEWTGTGRVNFSERRLSWAHTALDSTNAMRIVVEGKDVRTIPGCNRLHLSLTKVIPSDDGQLLASVEPVEHGYQVRFREKLVGRVDAALYLSGNAVATVVGLSKKGEKPSRPSETWIYPQSLTSCGEHIAWWQGQGLGDKATGQMFLDGGPVGPAVVTGLRTGLLGNTPVFSDNCQAIGFEARDEQDDMYIWSTIGESSKYKVTANPVWSTDGKAFAFQAMDKPTETFYVIGKWQSTSKYEHVYGGHFSQLGGLFAYVARLKGRYAVVAKEVEGPWFDQVLSEIIVLQDPNVVLRYVARDGMTVESIEILKGPAAANRH